MQWGVLILPPPPPHFLVSCKATQPQLQFPQTRASIAGGRNSTWPVAVFLLLYPPLTASSWEVAGEEQVWHHPGQAGMASCLATQLGLEFSRSLL